MDKKNRRDFLSKSLVLGSAALLPFSGLGTAVNGDPGIALPGLKDRKILFTSGGWEGHEPAKFAEYFTHWLKEEGAEVYAYTTLDPYADKALMSTIDLVIQIFTMSQITVEQEIGLLEAIEKNGTGMAGWHGGMCDSFRNNPDSAGMRSYHFMTGGQWVAHPGGVIGYEVKIVDHKDAVTAGLNDFNMKSEQYYMHVDPNVKVLATTRFNGNSNSWIDGCVMPVTWKKMHGKGRIFYTSVGHNLSHLTEQPAAMEMLKRGIQWASAGKYAPAEKWRSPLYER